MSKRGDGQSGGGGGSSGGAVNSQEFGLLYENGGRRVSTDRFFDVMRSVDQGEQVNRDLEVWQGIYEKIKNEKTGWVVDPNGLESRLIRGFIVDQRLEGRDVFSYTGTHDLHDAAIRDRKEAIKAFDSYAKKQLGSYYDFAVREIRVGTPEPPNPALSLTPGTSITKTAQRKFTELYGEAGGYVKAMNDRGESLKSFSVGYHSSQTETTPSVHTLKGIQALINSEHRQIDQRVKYGAMNQESARGRHAALNAVQKAINKQLDVLREIGRAK